MYVALCPFWCCGHLGEEGGGWGLVALLDLTSWCLVMVERLFLVVPLGCLQFVIVVFSDHTHLLFLLLISEDVEIVSENTNDDDVGIRDENYDPDVDYSTRPQIEKNITTVGLKI